MTFKLRILLIALALMASTSEGAWAQYFQADLMKKRQSDKQASRWTITDWLAQKKKFNLMDMWLASNRSKTIFEMDLGASQQDFTVDTETAGVKTSADYKSTRYKLSFFLYMFGLDLGYRDSDEGFTESLANINLRLLGSSQQSTRLNLKYGYRMREVTASSEEWGQQFAGAELNLYLTHFLGLMGEYNFYLKDSSNLGNELSGDDVSGGAFIEWGVLRLYGKYTKENEKRGTASITREGMEYGARLYF